MEAISIVAVTIASIIALLVFIKLLSSQKRVQELVAENSTVGTELKNIQAQLDEASSQDDAVREMEINQAKLNQRLANETESLERSAEARQRADKQIAELQSELQVLISENAKLQSDTKNRSELIKEIRVANEKLEAELKQLREQGTELSNAKSSLEISLKEAQERLGERDQLVKQGKALNEKLEAELKQLREQGTELSNAKSSLEISLKEAQERLGERDQLVKQGKALNEKLEAELKQLREQGTELSNAKSSLEISLKETQERLGDRDQLVKQGKALNEKLEAELKQLREQGTELSNAKSSLEISLKETQERLGDRDQLEKRFSDTFKALSTQTLEQQQKTFMENAGASLKEREQAVEKLVKPLSERIEALDKARVGSESAMKQQIEHLVQSNKEVANETRSLSTALSKPQARGRWGEMQVERALELSGLTKGIHYSAQASDGDGGRTDFIVHMPHNRDIILDSKVSLVAYLDAQNAKTEEGRNNHLERHARQMQSHASGLAKKEYWRHLPDAVDFVVMVVPEFALPPAVERRPDLIDQALQNKVVISAHSTLVALLKTVAMGWQERTIADEALGIGALGKELHDRLRVYTEHVAKVGNALDNAVLAYNASVGSFESRVLVQARRFPDLGVSNTKELAVLEPVDTSIRSMRPNNLAESNV